MSFVVGLQFGVLWALAVGLLFVIGGFAAVFWVVSFVVCCLLLIMLWYVGLYLIVVVWRDCLLWCIVAYWFL